MVVGTVLEARPCCVGAALTQLRADGHAAPEVRRDVEDAPQKALHEALRATVHNTSGSPGSHFGLPGVNTFCRPWSTRRLVERLHAFAPDACTWMLPGNLPAQARGEREDQSAVSPRRGGESGEQREGPPTPGR
ncbi:hypothetical protein OHB56_07725 [Streptomyces sp. NBC_01635]|uniref:hypothetical protein n=1 Tax=Streptomyces sp. NBC_01635 TaxID=2975904 RepID=UPI003865AADF|nr:hypothetical protein OHB56_07725 [Streptomyces sp. NBC_01635]